MNHRPPCSPSLSKRSRRALRPGFTLVEVLATLVLVGIVIPVAMRGVSLAMSAASNARRTAEAATLAEAKLNELIATREWEFGPASGDFGAEWPDYRWVMETAPGGYPTMTDIMLHVSWEERGQERTFTISTIAAVVDETTDTFGSGVLP